MGKRPSANSFGLSALPAVQPAGNAPTGHNPVERELVELLRRKRDLMTIREVEAMGQEPGPAPAVPGAATLTEMVSGAVAIAGLHKGAAEIAMAERETAERRAERVTAEADKRAEAARTEERGQGTMLLQLVQQFTQMNQTAVQAAHDTQIQLTERIHEAKTEALTAQVKGMIEQFNTQTGQRDAEIERLKAQLHTVAGRETWEERLARMLIEGRTDDPLLDVITRLKGPTHPPTADPNYIYQMGVAQAEVKKFEKQLLVEDQKLKHADENHQQMKGVIAGVGNLIQSAHEWLPGVLGAVTAVRGGDHNGVPSGFGAAYNAGGVYEDGTVQ